MRWGQRTLTMVEWGFNLESGLRVDVEIEALILEGRVGKFTLDDRPCKMHHYGNLGAGLITFSEPAHAPFDHTQAHRRFARPAVSSFRLLRPSSLRWTVADLDPDGQTAQPRASVTSCGRAPPSPWTLHPFVESCPGTSTRDGMPLQADLARQARRATCSAAGASQPRRC